MANVSFLGHAPTVAQVDTITVTGVVAIGNTFTVTINGKSVTYTATATTTASVRTGLAAALAASTITEFTELTFAEGVLRVDCTASVAGRSHAITVSKAQGTGGTNLHAIGIANVTPNSGPNEFNVASNWSGGAVPGAGDTLIFELSNIDLLYGLQHCVSTTCRVMSTYSGSIGLPERNPAGYDEYRATHLATAVPVEYAGTGARAKFYSLGAGAVVILNSANRSDPAEPTVCLTGLTTGASLQVYGGDVGVSVFSGHSSVIEDIVATPTNGNPLTLEIANTTGLENLTAADGAAVTLKGSVTPSDTLNIYDGAEVFLPTATTATVLNYGGILHAGGDVEDYSGSNGSTLDLTYRSGAKVINNCTLAAGSTISDPLASGSFTTGILLDKCKLEDVTLDVGYDVTITLS